MNQHLEAGVLRGTDEREGSMDVLPTCPPWCREAHGALAGEDDLVHVGATTVVGGVAVRLCVTIDGDGTSDGPYLLVGEQEYDVQTAADLAAILTRLVCDARSAVLRPGAARLTPPADRPATA